jgi:FolB domain-containing protein
MNLSPHDIPFNSLRLQELSLQVCLGCTAEERAVRQEVRLTVEFRFHRAPRGTQSDSLDETICYAELSEALKSHLEHHEYNLIERMAYEAFGIAKDISRGKAQIGLSVHKVSPPVENLKGGAWFSCGDFLP